MGLATRVGFFLVQKGDLFYSQVAIIGLGDMGAAVASAAPISVCRFLGYAPAGLRTRWLTKPLASPRLAAGLRNWI